MSSKHTPMVVAAAKELARLHSGECNVDFVDLWKCYGEQFIDDAHATLSACGAFEMLEVLCRYVQQDIMHGITENNLHRTARAAIAKATGENQ